MFASQPIRTAINDRPARPAAESLADLERDCWAQLTAALANKKDPFNNMTLATNTAGGADARMVVLRQVDTEHKSVWFHTDARAEKVIQLEANPNATLLFWDDERQVQLRLTVETQLHTNDYVADEHWKNLWVGGRKMYLSEHRPGSELPAPYPGFPPPLGEALPTDEASEAGRPNFAVFECRVTALAYLHLSRAGQTRAQFQYEPMEKMAWLAP